MVNINKINIYNFIFKNKLLKILYDNKIVSNIIKLIINY